MESGRAVLDVRPRFEWERLDELAAHLAGCILPGAG